VRDVLGLPNVDVGDGWLIFALPPAEVAVHPGDENDAHEFYLMAKDLGAFVELMKARGRVHSPAKPRVGRLNPNVTTWLGARLGFTSHATLVRSGRSRPSATRRQGRGERGQRVERAAERGVGPDEAGAIDWASQRNPGVRGTNTRAAEGRKQ
jgi:hypothetical protein